MNKIFGWPHRANIAEICTPLYGCLYGLLYLPSSTDKTWVVFPGFIFLKKEGFFNRKGEYVV